MNPYYEDDAVTIYHGDSREIEDVIQADVMLTDPPYSLSVETDHTNKPGRGTRRLNFFDGDTDWDTMTDEIVQVVAHMKIDVFAAYVWCGHRQFGPLVERFERDGWKTRPLVWRKACPVPAPPGVGWDSAVELCVYAFRAGRAWLPPTGTKVPNVIDADSYRHGQPGKVAHPTQKPIVTAALPIMYSCPTNGTVLDPFMGSGTTLVAAKNLGRKAIGIEIEERYCEIAAQRCSQDVLAL
jgi:site-specific DNA-methyltransferase (adenine-specific)